MACDQHATSIMTLSLFCRALPLACLLICFGSGAEEPGRAASSAAPGVVVRTEKAVVRGVKAAASGVERGARAAARGIEHGVKAAEGGVRHGVKAAARGVERGAQATASAAHSVARKVDGSPASTASGRD
jgi:hypothetical protein